MLKIKLKKKNINIKTKRKIMCVLSLASDISAR